MSLSNRLASLLASTALAGPALAEVAVSNAWVRATVAGQSSTGAFMTLESPRDLKVVEARSPLARVVEIHEMKIEGTVMRMRAVAELPLPAGKPVELKPGGYHVMLMALKKPVREGDEVPLTLVVEAPDRTRKAVEVTARARPLAASHADAPRR